MFPCRDYSIFRCVADREPVATGVRRHRGSVAPRRTFRIPALKGVRRSARTFTPLARKKSGARESSECTVNPLSTATRPFCCVAGFACAEGVRLADERSKELCEAKSQEPERRNPLLFPRSAAARGVHADCRADEAAGRAGREHIRLLLAANLTPLAVGLAPKEGESVVASFDAKG